jgi:hypothetical protein
VDDTFTWKFLLQGAPSRVFCSLVRAASQEGRVCGVENYGTTLTFTPTRRDVDQAGRMRAVVRSCPEGSMVIIGPAEPGHRPDACAIQAQSVASLMQHLRAHFSEQHLLASA